MVYPDICLGMHNSTNKSYKKLSYRREAVRCYCCYKMRTGNRTQAFEWCHFISNDFEWSVT